MTHHILRPALILAGLLLAVPAFGQSRDRRDSGQSRSRTQPQPQPAELEFPNLYLAKPLPPSAVQTFQAPSPLVAIWDRLGVGSATSIDLNQNSALRSTLRRMGVSVPRDGILRKPTASSAAVSASTGSVIINARTGLVITVAGDSAAVSGRSVSAPTGPGYTYQPPPPAGWAGSVGPAEVQGAAEEEEVEVVRHDNLPEDAPSFWAELDTDRDAQLSLFEWRTGGRPVEEFVARDANSDGYLILEEYTRSLELLPAVPTPAKQAQEAGRPGR